MRSEDEGTLPPLLIKKQSCFNNRRIPHREQGGEHLLVAAGMTDLKGWKGGQVETSLLPALLLRGS